MSTTADKVDIFIAESWVLSPNLMFNRSKTLRPKWPRPKRTKLLVIIWVN